MKKQLLAGVCPLLMAFAYTAQAEHCPHHHASHSISQPMGVTGGHLHEKGQWMVSYRYDFTRQSGLRQGSSNLPAVDALAIYGEAMTEMDMGMHMAEAMYGITDKLTLMVMGGFMDMDMTHMAHHSLHTHEMEKQGWGDTEVTALYSLLDRQVSEVSHKLHLNAGLSLPTGSIDESYVNHHNANLHLPYTMQFGSGTYDPILGLTYTGGTGAWGWGAQALNTFRLGENSNGYRQGHRQVVNLWGSRGVTDFLDLSLRLEGKHWGNVHGKDDRIPLTSMTGANPLGNGGEQLSAFLGANLKGSGKLEGQQLGAEFGMPFYEHFDGPQLETDYRLSLGWRMAF